MAEPMVACDTKIFGMLNRFAKCVTFTVEVTFIYVTMVIHKYVDELLLSLHRMFGCWILRYRGCEGKLATEDQVASALKLESNWLRIFEPMLIKPKTIVGRALIITYDRANLNFYKNVRPFVKSRQIARLPKRCSMIWNAKQATNISKFCFLLCRNRHLVSDVHNRQVIWSSYSFANNQFICGGNGIMGNPTPKRVLWYPARNGRNDYRVSRDHELRIFISFELQIS